MIKADFNSIIWGVLRDAPYNKGVAMEQIVRGTTPSLIIDFSGVTEIPDFNVEDISAASLVIKRRTQRLELGLADMSVEDNKLSYHFTQEQTLAFTAGEIITLDMHIVVNGERYKVYGVPETISVVNTQKNEVM